MGDRPPAGFRWLLRLLPAPFRDHYGADMAATFQARRADARRDGRLATVGLWWRTAVSLAGAAVAEHRRSSLHGARRNPAARAGKESVMSGVMNDLRFAFRQVRRQPAYAAFVALTLAVGIGATTAVFSVVNGVLLRPLPYPDAGQLIAVWGRFLPESGFDFPEFPLSVPEYVDYRDHTKAMQAVAAFQTGIATVGAEEGEPERVPFAAITPNTLTVLRVPVALGRDFAPADGLPGAPQVVILSHGYWQRRYAGDPQVIGRTIRVTGIDRTIVGIAPATFGFPSRETALWRAFTIDPANPGNRQGHSTNAIARLADGVTIETAHAEVAALMERWKAEYPTIHTGHFLFVRPLLEDVVGPVARILVLLLAATAFLLLIVCANVSNAMLARGEGRMREMAIRAALGAERRRLLRLAGLESLVLAAAGGVGGVVIAWLGVRGLRALDHSGLPRVHDVAIDGGVLAFAAGVTVLSACVFGMAPALRGSASRPGAAMRHDDRTSSAGAARLRFRRGLVVGEVALTVVLVVGAGLMLQSLRRVLGVDPGFDARGVVFASVSLPAASYPSADHVEAFYRDVVDRLRAVPGVSAATAASLVPMVRGDGVWDFEIAGRPAPAAGAPAWNAAFAAVRDDYFEVLGVPIRRGRGIGPDDRAGQPPVVVINESFAAKFFAGTDPLGQRIRIANTDSPRAWATIVGIAGDLRDQDLETDARPLYFMSQAQTPVTSGAPFRSMAIVARTETADAVSGALRQIVRGIDPGLPLTVQHFDAAIAQSYAPRSFATTLFAIFAVVGLLLGATGIYAVLAYSVARLTPEIGIRRALGAASGSILVIVVRQGLAPAALGLVVGAGAAAWLSSFLESQLFGVSALDPGTYAVVMAAVLVVAVTACSVPAHRALRVSPSRALREA